jgi:hypothetical protein
MTDQHPRGEAMSPYDVYAIRPTKAFALRTDGESTAPTRWRFSSPA